MPDRALRGTFDSVAELYDQARPGYPPMLFADLDLAGRRVLEIGAGTGQATRDLLAAGAVVTCAEPGPHLAGLLVSKLPEARVLGCEFEAVPDGVGPFDSIVSFTAWHWVDPQVRADRVLALLAEGGCLVTVSTVHVAGGSTTFFEQVQECYRRWLPGTPAHFVLPCEDEVEGVRDELDEDQRFEVADRRTYGRQVAYPTKEYVDVLRTYSETLALAPAARDGLLLDIAALIDAHHGGSVVKQYLYDVRTLVRRRPGRPSSAPRSSPSR